MAKEKSMIVIKKITVAGGGHHGGSWKVALADFMTAMMAFFLVMWLLGQSEDTKKAVSDYFSTPSLIEYSFENFGAEITLEKLFLDLVNDPLKAIQSFLEPADKTPNLLDMGSAKVVSAFLADKVNDFANNVTVRPDGYDFDIPDNVLFDRGTAEPRAQFVDVMDKVTGVTTGLEDATIKITSGLYVQSVPEATQESANKIASLRLDIVKNKIQATLEHTSVDVSGNISVKEKKGEVNPDKLVGFIRISIRQKENASGEKRRRLDTLFGQKTQDTSLYQDYLKKEKPKKKFGKDESLKNPIEEMQPINHVQPEDPVEN